VVDRAAEQELMGGNEAEGGSRIGQMRMVKVIVAIGFALMGASRALAAERTGWSF